VRFPDDVPVLCDGEVTLRAHRPEDAEGVLEQCLDPVSQRWTTVPVPYTRQDAERFVTEAVPAGWARGRWAFAVHARDDSGTERFAGTVELREEGNRRAEVAYGAAPWARGRGLVGRAVGLLLDWGFTEQGLRVVSWWANRGNWPSRRLAWRLGFSCDGTVRRWLPQRGDLLDGWFGVLHVDDPRTPRGAWPRAPRLAGRHVVLRELRDADGVRAGDGLPGPLTAQEWLLRCGEGAADGTQLSWALADPVDDRFLGFLGAADLTSGRGAELDGWEHPEARGRGLVAEACVLAARHCLTPYDAGGLGLARVRAGTGVQDAASVRVLAAGGFSRVGVERRVPALPDGRLVDRLAHELLVEDL
jgi:RimJ/RimL family protein N-acetyltransferase